MHDKYLNPVHYFSSLWNLVFKEQIAQKFPNFRKSHISILETEQLLNNRKHAPTNQDRGPEKLYGSLQWLSFKNRVTSTNCCFPQVPSVILTVLLSVITTQVISDYALIRYVGRTHHIRVWQAQRNRTVVKALALQAASPC